MNSLVKLLSFITVFSVIYCSMHLAVAQWLIMHFHLPAGRVRLIFTAAALSFFACAWLVHGYSNPLTRFLITGAYIWMGVIFIWLSVIAASLVPELLVRLWRLDSGPWFAWGVIIATAVLSGYAIIAGYHTPRVHNVEIPVESLPRALDGVRIAQISDVHLS
ncbi:MAG: hypothetical protein PHW69_09535, partial [Elusimicrobiaceae bacterium]|nr:hypothetical protein [Elusimicrobiaceae bacterium]